MITIFRTKDLFEKTCKHCGKIFRTDKARAYVCPTCLKKNVRDHLDSYRQEAKREDEKRKKKNTASIPLMDMLKIIENYNRKNGTSYTYGKFEELVNSGKIKI